MRKTIVFWTLFAVVSVLEIAGQTSQPIANPAIDMKSYLKIAERAAKLRETRRLTEEEFIRLSKEPGTIVLDARSRERFDDLHIDGAVNLSFPDFTEASLSELIPNKDTRVLIYCNNNFVGADRAFPMKASAASLNLSTFIALYTYGYRNIYELGPLLDVRTTLLELVSKEKALTAETLTSRN